jgi:hypothetical protein
MVRSSARADSLVRLVRAVRADELDEAIEALQRLGEARERAHSRAAAVFASDRVESTTIGMSASGRGPDAAGPRELLGRP